MKSGKKQDEGFQKCELCDRKTSPEIYFYKIHTQLCSACFHRMQILPELVTDNLSRFLIGNVI